MEENINYLYVLEYSVGRIIQIEIEGNVDENNISDILDHYNLKESECSYMWVDHELELEETTFCPKQHKCANFAPCICDEHCHFEDKTKLKNMLKVKFIGIDSFGREVYRAYSGGIIKKLDDGFYSVADESDFDSEPYAKLNSSKIEVVR